MKRKMHKSGRYFAVTRAAAVETLETRRLLASIVVNSNADDVTPDDGQTTLREAIIEANSDSTADKIHFALGHGAHTINLASALPELFTDMEIDGPGADLLTVRRDTGGAYRILTIPAGATVFVSGLTIADGKASSASFDATGGGIHNRGTLTVTDCTIRDNNADFPGFGSGGGIWSSGTLVIENSVIAGNKAGASSGGGINAGGTVTITDCTISGNIAGTGGGIAASGTFNISGTTFSANAAVGGGGILASGGILTIIDCNFSENTATIGGAIRIRDGTVAVTASTLSDNHAGDEQIPGGGGAIYNGNGDLTVTDCTITDNQAEFGDGGGIYNGGALTVRNSTISDNTAGSAGGGIYNPFGTLVVEESTFSGNRVTRGAGGAILRNGADAAATITDTTVIGNSAGAGGGIFNAAFVQEEEETPALALAPVFQQLGVLTVTGCTLSSNSAGYGGGIFNAGEFSVKGTTISGNSTSGFGGGVINSGGQGVIENSTISGNLLQGIFNTGMLVIRTSAITGHQGGNEGGGIQNSEALTLEECTVSDNTAVNAAGISNSGELTIKRSTLSANTATNLGGAIGNVFPGIVKLSDSTVSGNSAFAGGGIFNNHQLDIVNSTISENSAVSPDSMFFSGGGGIFSGSSSLTINNSTIVRNTSRGVGGGIKSPTTGSVVPIINNSIVALNTAPIGPDVFRNVAGSFNLIGNSAGMGGITNGVQGNQIGTAASPIDPKLGPLAGNGGPTKTIALLPGSPCINAGDPNFMPPPAFDQRGSPFKRVIGGRVDIGAFEFATAAQMADELRNLVAGLASDVGASLLPKLNLKGNSGDAGKVGAFINQLDAFIHAGKLSEAQADPLLELAEFLFDSLR